jgi:site-specific DNA recombinase
VAALYPRVSDPAQDRDDKTSLKTQEAGERAWADANGYAVDEQYIYRERHSAEEYYERPELTRLRADAKARRFSVVVVHSVERLARDAIHVGIILEELERAGVKVHFVSEPDDDSPDSQLIRFVKAYAGKVENERKKERTMRSTRERARLGKPLIGCRVFYGYQWGPEVYPTGHPKAGRLTKERMLPDPATSVIVVRIFTEVAEGRTLRAIARGLTQDGIPSPTVRAGRASPAAGWVGNTIRYLVQEARYWGAGEALGTKQEPVEKQLRPRYARKTRTTHRDPAERIPVPTSSVPPLVSPELAAAVHARLHGNQAHAMRNNHYPERALLRGGLARCGSCGGVLCANNKHNPSGILHTVYRCGAHVPVGAGTTETAETAETVRHRCHGRTVEAHLLDDATWRAVVALLSTPGLLERERAYLRETERPGTDTLAAIDRLIAGLNTQIARKRRLYEGTDDEQTQDDLQREINDLAAVRRGHEKERVNAELHYADWQQQEAGIDYALAWRERWAGKLDRAESYAERRAILEAVHTTVRVWGVDHTPRAIVYVRLPLSGEMTHDLHDLCLESVEASEDDADSDEKRNCFFTSAISWPACVIS